MASQGFFSGSESAEKRRFAGEKENNAAFNVKVEPVKVANNINKYNEQTPSLDYAPDRVGDYIRESETKSYKSKQEVKQDDGIFADRNKLYREQAKERGSSFIADDKGLGLDYSYGRTFSPFMNHPSRFDKKDYGVPFSENEKRVTTAQQSYDKLNEYGRTQISDENYKKLQSDYASYQPERDRREFRKGVEDNLSDFRKDYMADFNKADYAIKMKQYNPDGTEKDINKYNKSLDEQIDNLSRLRQTSDDFGPNYSLDRFGNVLPRSEVDAYNKKVDAEEAERTRLSKEKAKLNYEQSQKNIFQKIGDTVGDVFNKLTGTLPAQGDTLQSQGINTNATVSIAQMGNVSPSVQRSRDAVARSNLRKSGLNRTVGGQSSQANYGRSRKGFGTGTHGKGMPSNPKGMRQQGVGVSANNLSRHSVGHSSTQPKGNQGNQGGNQGGNGGDGGDSTNQNQGLNQSLSRRRGRTGSKGGGKSSGGGGGGSPGGGSPGGGGGINRSRKRRRCDVRCKIDISPLINSNLVKDDLAKVAYFVQEIK